MEFTDGMIVKSVQGHDAGKHFIVVGTKDNFVYISEGKCKRLLSPKKKNKKHIVLADEQLIDLKTQTDKSVRRLVNLMNQKAKQL